MSDSQSYSDFFRAAYEEKEGDEKSRNPYVYQETLAQEACTSRLISIPTGLGKTAAVILAWLWNRVYRQDAGWPRRLVYCLPMRTLVEQTRDEAVKWIENLTAHLPQKPRVVVLMGGEELDPHAKDWDIYPEENAILIGTQDMLLSRALNRGYGMSRYRWPMHFGLLNNDCLWVMDETQLMGVGVETSAQLDGFRHLPQWLRELPCPTWWMSATLEATRLATVDHPMPEGGWPRHCLEEGDRALPQVQKRLGAVKRLHRAELVLSKQVKPDQYAKELAKLVLGKHIQGSLTLVIVNRVQRAQELHAALEKAGRKENLALVHARFRKPDRDGQQDLLIDGKGDRIVVATQAVEAGVDVSARLLITELAPWSSLVQRFGRCNRGGEYNEAGADIYWIDLALEDKKDTAPYQPEELDDARAELKKLEGENVGPDALSSVHITPPVVIRPVIRKKDLVELFDTTPDIAGHDLDISRYIREGEDNDVQVFWRDVRQPAPDAETKSPTPEELCRVAVHRFQAFLDKLKKANDERSAFAWDGLRDEWVPATRARAGGVYLIDHRASGYSSRLGWTGELASLKKEVEWTAPLTQQASDRQDSTQRDPLTQTGYPLTLEVHTGHVVDQMRKLLTGTGLSERWHEPLMTAARWHDVGKGLEDFQTMLRSAAGENAPKELLAKSGKKGGSMPPWRKYFRHELASALAWLQHHDGTDQADLVAYIIAAHHGKVRLSIRSLPNEEPPPACNAALMARGIVEGDKLPMIHMDELTMPATQLHLGLMRMGSDENGRRSWLARMIDLRDRMGPLHLALLESLLRAADMWVSAVESRPESAS